MKPLYPTSTATLNAVSKTEFGFGRPGSRVHRIRELRAEVVGGRLRYAARWHCRKQVARDVTLLLPGHGLPACDDCTDRLHPSVYRCFAAGERLAYVGSSIKRTRRLRQHSLYSPWWQFVTEVRFEEFQTYEAAFAAELTAIRAEAPAFNKANDGKYFVPPEMRMAIAGDLFEIVDAA